MANWPRFNQKNMWGLSISRMPVQWLVSVLVAYLTWSLIVVFLGTITLYSLRHRLRSSRSPGRRKRHEASRNEPFQDPEELLVGGVCRSLNSQTVSAIRIAPRRAKPYDPALCVKRRSRLSAEIVSTFPLLEIFYHIDVTEKKNLTPLFMNFSWPEEVRVRGGVSTPDPDSTASCVTSECRAIGIGGRCDEDMSGKPTVESNGASGVSSWLRESMRRVRHFNLGEPPRIRSAPPDSLRFPDESVVNVENSERVNSQNEVQQQQPSRARTNCNRLQRRNQPRSRPASLPARRPPTLAAPVQSQTESAQPVPLTVSAPEAQENLGYESDSTDRHPSPRG